VFTPDPSIQYVPATREQVVALVEGINQPQITIPGRAPQGVSGHLVALRNADGSFSIVVALHLPKSGENVIYLHGKRRCTAEEYRDIQDEGLHFLESMGFMLDNLNFRNLAPEQQEATVRRVALFSPPKAPPPSAEAKAGTEAARVARLLASF
jgi:hypothetical protein